MPLLSHLSDRGVLTLTLNRPEKHNALNAELIAALQTALEDAARNDQVRVIVLTGAGASFCAGADIAYMRSTLEYTQEQNLQDARALARCLRTLDEIERPVIAKINGNAFGGGLGLIACADIALGSTAAQFALTEVRLGLVPATISPYVVAAIGARQARRLFLTAQSFDAREAVRLGLLHAIAEPDQLEASVEQEIDALLRGGPRAQRAAKRLVRTVVDAADRDRLQEDTSRLLAELRTGDEAKERMTAFLERRK